MMQDKTIQDTYSDMTAANIAAYIGNLEEENRKLRKQLDFMGCRQREFGIMLNGD